MGSYRFCSFVTYVIVTEIKLVKGHEAGEVGRKRFRSIVTYATPVETEHL